MEHDLKCISPHFAFISVRLKTFELRKDDRNYQVNDTLLLREFLPNIGYSGRSVKVKIQHILRNAPEFGLMEGYCIMSLSHPQIV